MAITGIDTIEGKQIIAAGAVSAKSAEMAYNDENGNPITGYQIAGDYYSASNPSGFITGVDLTPYQTTAEMTAYQPAGDYLTTADSAEFYTTANESGFITNDTITGKQDVTGMTAYQPVGDYYSASNPSGFITGVDLSDYATTAELADKQDISGMTAYQPVGNYQTAGDYLTTADSANFYTTANESGFITGVDLTPYQLTADMTAYQSAGDYLTTADSGNFYPMTGNPSGFINELPEEEEVEFEEIDLTDYQPVSSMTAYQSAGDYYSASNPSGFISEVPDTYLQNTDLSTTDGKVTAISGIPLSAGGDVPEGVMVESGLEYNAVDEISGYNGSAIAQYGAEKQWLVHDDTLVHAANSAQYALGVNLSAVAQLLGVDETVLFSGMRTTGTITLAEAADNFNRVKILYCINDGISNSVEVIPESSGVKVGMATFGYYNGYCREKGIIYTLSGNTLTPDVSAAYFRGGNNTSVTASTETPANAFRVNAVYGIGRKGV